MNYIEILDAAARGALLVVIFCAVGFVVRRVRGVRPARRASLFDREEG